MNKLFNSLRLNFLTKKWDDGTSGPRAVNKHWVRQSLGSPVPSTSEPPVDTNPCCLTAGVRTHEFHCQVYPDWLSLDKSSSLSKPRSFIRQNCLAYTVTMMSWVWLPFQHSSHPPSSRSSILSFEEVWSILLLFFGSLLPTQALRQHPNLKSSLPVLTWRKLISLNQAFSSGFPFIANAVSIHLFAKVKI